MALANFITEGSYTRINRISVRKEDKFIDFEIKVYKEKDGALILPPVPFQINYPEKLENYKEENTVFPDAPVYPVLCSTREASVPMWTDTSTDEEKAEYDSALAAYNQAVETHETTCADLISAVETAAETENEYTKYFSDQKLYTDSNATACAYEFLKSKSGFEGVVDV